MKRTLWIATAIVTVARVGQSTTRVSTSESMRINDPRARGGFVHRRARRRAKSKEIRDAHLEKRLFEREEALGYSASGL